MSRCIDEKEELLVLLFEWTCGIVGTVAAFAFPLLYFNNGNNCENNKYGYYNDVAIVVAYELFHNSNVSNN